ncbi:hypothetical protein Tco_0322877 [Tanacetum coccineum]
MLKTVQLESLKKVQHQFFGYLEDQDHLHFSLSGGSETEEDLSKCFRPSWSSQPNCHSTTLLFRKQDDQMNSVIKCLTAKSTWDDLILYHEGPSDVKESRVMDLKLCYNMFKSRKDEEDVSSDDNDMIEVKVLMALVDDENVVVGKKSAINGEWVKIFMRKAHILLDMKDNDKRNSFLDYLCVERPWLSEAEGFTLPNHNTGRILPAESQVKITDPTVAITDSLATKYDSADESLVCSTYLPPLEKLAGAKPVSGPKTIKSILKSNLTFKVDTLKGVTINEPSSPPTKGNKNGSASKNNSAPAGKLKNVKTKDDSPLSIVMKELNDLKLQISKN